MATIQQTAGNVLFIRQRVQTNIKAIYIRHRLTFAQAATATYLPQSAGSFLRFRQLAVVSKKLNIEVIHDFDLSQTTQPRVKVEEVVSWFYPYHDITNQNKWPLTRHTLGLTQEVEVSKARGLNNSLTLVHTVSLSKTKVVTPTNSLGLVQGAAVFKPSQYFMLGIVQGPPLQSKADTLTLAQSISQTQQYSRISTNTLTLSQVAIAEVV